MIKFRKARSSWRTLSDLESYLTLNGGEPLRLLEREVQSWGEYSYEEIERAIEEGHLNELLRWQERYAKVVNELMAPAWWQAMRAASSRATGGRVVLEDSDVEVKEWLRKRGGELISHLSEEARRAIGQIILRGQALKTLPQKMAQQIRPLIGLTTRQMLSNERYREKVYRTLREQGQSESKAEAQAQEAARRYASKQQRERAETIVQTELAFAYNRGADIGVKRAIREGLMTRCALIWSTAGTNRVCPRCLALKDKVIGYSDEEVQLPPLHPRCRCAIRYEEAIEMPRRRRAQDGHEIIDKPTYHRLTNWFTRSGGLIIRGEEAQRHLASSGASASYMVGANAAFITDDATISDVLEEMYHAKQDRAKKFGEITEDLVWLKREIEAQKYLLDSAKRYKIPPEETAVTLQNLKHYEELLEAALHEN